MKIGYKGFDKDLKCRGFQFEVGQVYEKPEKEAIKLCTADGFHYCNELKHVFHHYSFDGNNRFCEVEILGNFLDEKPPYGDKSITTKFRIIREITTEIGAARIQKKMSLDTLVKLQTNYPTAHIGGSVGLYLHGVFLKRWAANDYHPDLDITVPYFVAMQQDELYAESEPAEDEDYRSDFVAHFSYDGTEVDMNIDPKMRWEIIEYNGFKLKVTALEDIMTYKMKYVMKGKKKHKEDLYEMLGKNKERKVVPVIDIPLGNDGDLPW